VFMGRYETSKRDLSFSFHPSGDNPLRDASGLRPLDKPHTGGPWAYVAEACRFLHVGQDQDNDYGRVRVPDVNDKDIFRISPRYAGDNLDFTVNGEVVGSRSRLDWILLMLNRPKLFMGYDATKRLFVDFADFPRFYPAAVAEPGADPARPAAIGVEFHTEGTREYGVNFVNLDFLPLSS
jgi:hypothetical protein